MADFCGFAGVFVPGGAVFCGFFDVGWGCYQMFRSFCVSPHPAPVAVYWFDMPVNIVVRNFAFVVICVAQKLGHQFSHSV